MDSISIVAMASIFGAALAMAIGSLGPGSGYGTGNLPGAGGDRPAAG